MARKNPMVRIGRPPSMGAPAGIKKIGVGAPSGLKGPALGASPMAGFNPAVPAASFSRGGGVHGHKPMPAHHDDPAYCKGGRTK